MLCWNWINKIETIFLCVVKYQRYFYGFSKIAHSLVVSNWTTLLVVSHIAFTLWWLNCEQVCGVASIIGFLVMYDAFVLWSYKRGLYMYATTVWYWKFQRQRYSGCSKIYEKHVLYCKYQHRLLRPTCQKQRFLIFELIFWGAFLTSFLIHGHFPGPLTPPRPAAGAKKYDISPPGWGARPFTWVPPGSRPNARAAPWLWHFGRASWTLPGGSFIWNMEFIGPTVLEYRY